MSGRDGEAKGAAGNEWERGKKSVYVGEYMYMCARVVIYAHVCVCIYICDYLLSCFVQVEFVTLFNSPLKIK